MQVSKSLRLAVQGAQFWRERSFLFERLVPSTLDPSLAIVPSLLDPPLAVWTVNLCRALVSDPFLAEQLRAKTEWSFRTTETAELIARDVDLPLRDSVKTLDLFFDKTPSTLQYLSEFHYVVNLSLICRDVDQSLDLNNVAEALAKLPLKRLYFGYPRKMTGSLNVVRTLEDLTLTPAEAETSGEVAPASVLPSGSARTLKTLTTWNCTTESLHQFLQLESLAIGTPWDARTGIETMLLSYTGRLSQLRILIPLAFGETVDSDYIHHWEIFDCNCVREVTSLQLTIHPETMYSEYVETCTHILGRVTTNLPMLQDLTVCGGMDMDKAPDLLSRLHHLKSLSWLYPKGGVTGTRLKKNGDPPEGYLEESFRLPRIEQSSFRMKTGVCCGTCKVCENRER
jgi:hypothetical protein